MTEEQRESIYLRQKIDCNCNDCYHMIRDFERTKRHQESYEGTGLSDKLVYGFCIVFNLKRVSFSPNTCQIETQDCFEHRKDFKKKKK